MIPPSLGQPRWPRNFMPPATAPISSAPTIPRLYATPWSCGRRWNSRLVLFWVDPGLATGRAGRRDHRCALWADRRRRLRHPGIDIAGRMNDAALAVELVAQGLGRTAAGRRIFWDGLRRGFAGALVLVRRSGDRKSTRLNSSHQIISYAVFC